MAAITIHSDFGAEKNKVSHCLNHWFVPCKLNNFCNPVLAFLQFFNGLLLLLLLSCFSHIQLCATPETAAHQAPAPLGFSRQEYWSGLPFPSPAHACVLNRFSRVWLYVTPWTAAHQAPLSTGFSWQEYWSGLPSPSSYLSIDKWNCYMKCLGYI